MCNDRITTRATEELKGVCIIAGTRRTKATAMQCIFWGISLYHTLTGILNSDASSCAACRSFNWKTSTIPPSSSLLSFLLISRFILSHQSPKSHRFPPQSPETPLSFMLSLALVLGHPRKSPCFGSPPFSSSSTYLFTEPNSPEWLPSYTRLSPGISWRQCPVLFLCSIHTHHVLMFSVW